MYFVNLFIATNKNGTKTIPTVMATNIPKNTPVPISRRAAEPGPEANKRGRRPSINARDVITIGRKRKCAAVSAA